jgi:hypothetical protein
MTRRSTLTALVFATCLVSLTSVPSAWAVGEEAEIWFGYYSPDPSFLDSDISFGGRTLWPASERLHYGVEVGWVSTDGTATDGLQTGHVDWRSFFMDLVGDLDLTVGKKVTPVFTFGLGGAFQNVDTNLAGFAGSVSVDDLNTSSFTFQGGFGVKIDLGKAYFLRPAARVRWYTNRNGDDLDTEYLLGFGVRW